MTKTSYPPILSFSRLNRSLTTRLKRLRSTASFEHFFETIKPSLG